MKSKRCEGWTRHGGAFTFGPVTWKQCENQGIVLLKFREGKETKTLPACKDCWNKCIEKGIKILTAKPL